MSDWKTRMEAMLAAGQKPSYDELEEALLGALVERKLLINNANDQTAALLGALEQHKAMVLGWAGGASAQQQPDRSPAAFALSIGAITNTIKTVFTLAEAEQELAALNPPGQFPAWRIVQLFCDDPRYPESECARPGSQCCGSTEFCPRDKCVLTAVSDAAINQPLV